jgi:hypothetical protein
MDNKKNIYIMLTHSGSIPSSMIKFYTREPYSHVSISFDVNLNEMYSFGRKKIRNPLVGGFVTENIESGIYLIFTETTYALYTLSVSEEQYRRIKENILEFERMKDDFSYNFAGLLGIMLGYPVNRQNSYFCSQFVAYLLERSGVEIFDKPFGLVTPKDFRTCSSLKLLKSGKLSYFNSEMNIENAMILN